MGHGVSMRHTRETIRKEPTWQDAKITHAVATPAILAAAQTTPRKLNAKIAGGTSTPMILATTTATAAKPMTPTTMTVREVSMNGRHGTPKTLKQAIYNAIDEGSPSGNNIDTVMHAHVRDFICQKFSYAYITANPREMELLKRLFSDLTSEDESAVDGSLDYYMKRIRFQIASDDHAKQFEKQLKGVLDGNTEQTNKEQK